MLFRGNILRHLPFGPGYHSLLQFGENQLGTTIRLKMGKWVRLTNKKYLILQPYEYSNSLGASRGANLLKGRFFRDTLYHDFR